MLKLHLKAPAVLLTLALEHFVFSLSQELIASIEIDFKYRCAGRLHESGLKSISFGQKKFSSERRRSSGNYVSITLSWVIP